MSNSLSAVHPELVAEWSDRNLPLTPDSITFGSNKKVWWKYVTDENGQFTTTMSKRLQPMSIIFSLIRSIRLYLNTQVRIPQRLKSK